MDTDSEHSVNDSDLNLTPFPPQHPPPIERLPRALVSLIDDSASQLRLVTLPNDTSQLKFLNSVESMTAPVEKITAFVNFLVHKVASTALETTKMFREMQRAREELRISENKASRLLLHLQQNVKLLTRVATHEGETTIMQEAAQNVSSVSELECTVPPSYLKQLRQALSDPVDRLAGLEVLELLKQEIAINTVLRHQTGKLFETSTRLEQSIADLKTELSQRGTDPLKSELKKSQAALAAIAGFLKCPVHGLQPAVIKVLEENADQQRTLELLKRKYSELTKKNSEQSNELEIVKHQLQQREESEKRGQKVRMQLLKELGIAVKGTSEVDALIFAASNAIPIVEAHKVVCQLLETNSEQASAVVEALKAENEKFRQTIEQNRALMASQAETIQALQDTTWHQWGRESGDRGEAPSGDRTDVRDETRIRVEDGSANESDELQLEADAQFTELRGLNDQFTSIERELDELRQQIDARYEMRDD
jgi:hypothetical protein